MADTPEQEQRRLSELYGHMTEGELREIAGDAVDLTDMARQLLIEEIGKRGLDIRLAEAEAVSIFEARDMVTLRQFRDLPEALLAKGSLIRQALSASLSMTIWFAWTGSFRTCSAALGFKSLGTRLRKRQQF